MHPPTTWHDRLSGAINVLIPLSRHNRHWRCFTLRERFNKRGIVRLTVTRPLKNFDYFAPGVVGEGGRGHCDKNRNYRYMRRPPCRVALHVKIGRISHWRRRALKWFMLSSRFILLLLSRALPRVHGCPEFISLTTAAAHSSATKRISLARCKFATITLQRGPRASRQIASRQSTIFAYRVINLVNSKFNRGEDAILFYLLF